MKGYTKSAKRAKDHGQSLIPAIFTRKFMYVYDLVCFVKLLYVCLTFLYLRLVLKNAVAGFVYVQTVCYLLWDALLSVWTWLCISRVGLLGYWWYLAPQCTLDYSDLMGLFVVRL